MIGGNRGDEFGKNKIKKSLVPWKCLEHTQRVIELYAEYDWASSQSNGAIFRVYWGILRKQ